jgi:hypothetical protein
MDDSRLSSKQMQTELRIHSVTQTGQVDRDVEKAPVDATLTRFTSCMSQAINWMHQNKEFESICFYSRFLQQLDAHDLSDPLGIPAAAIRYFGTFGLFFDTAVVGVILFLGGSLRDAKLIRLISQSRTSSTQQCVEALLCESFGQDASRPRRGLSMRDAA